MRKNKARLTKDDVEYIKKSDMKANVLAALFKCSVSTINYHRQVGIWRKR